MIMVPVTLFKRTIHLSLRLKGIKQKIYEEELE